MTIRVAINGYGARCDDGRRDHAAIRRPCATYFPWSDQAKRTQIVKYSTVMVRHHCTQATDRELPNDGIGTAESKRLGTRQREWAKGLPTPNAGPIFAGGNARHFLKSVSTTTCFRAAMRCRTHVEGLHQLWNDPKGADIYGAPTVGSSEAFLLAGPST
jgi:hypothetical protein